ncbi:uncharacterized protein LOC129614297 [Condylostylus longicornis]|uniref:uncharacterized protein LOC129614297 n=1 Tax=Condylostylus longicornis TaxID=2530218 RepID=UPI00244DCC32|nr:uncharacterized protein LOC129614297 [Condylostylus longicornis]
MGADSTLLCKGTAKFDLLCLIESRIDSLKKILNSVSSSTGDEDFCESLISANSLIASTMSGHQQTIKAASRYAEIESYTNSLEKPQDAKAKQMCVKSIATTLAVTFEMLKKIKELESTIGAEYFKSLPDVSDLIERTNKQLREAKQNNELIEESLILAMQRYSALQKTTTNFLKSIDEKLTEIEENTRPKDYVCN